MEKTSGRRQQMYLVRKRHERNNNSVIGDQQQKKSELTINKRKSVDFDANIGLHNNFSHRTQHRRRLTQLRHHTPTHIMQHIVVHIVYTT